MHMYGSYQNRIAEQMIGMPKPAIGMGATEMCYSDRRAYEVIDVKDERHITVRRMKAICNDWYAGDWKVSSDTDGYTEELFLTRNGQWRQRTGRKLGNVFVIGYAKEYEDPSF